MAIKTSPKLEKLLVEAVSFTYPILGTEYKHPAYCVEFSPTLTRTGKNYYDSKEEIPEGDRMSTAAEELAIQFELEKAGQDPRKAKVFGDLFARNEGGWYAWQWTETGLRVPKGWKTEDIR